MVGPMHTREWRGLSYAKGQPTRVVSSELRSLARGVATVRVWIRERGVRGINEGRVRDAYGASALDGHLRVMLYI